MVKKNEEILFEIRDRVVAIETHLKDMNGKLIKHDSFLTEKCPERHAKIMDQCNYIQRNIDKVSVKTAMIMGGIGSITTILLYFIGNLIVKLI